MLRRIGFHFGKQSIGLQQQLIEILSLFALQNRIESRFHRFPFKCRNYLAGRR